MRRVAAVGSMMIWLGSAGVSAGDDNLPPLQAPGTSTSSEPSSSPPAASTAPSTPRAESGPVLAVPGLVDPRRVRSRAALPALEPAGPAIADDLPPLIGPSDRPQSQPAPNGLSL
jgi:hypothetical protein